MKKFMVKNKNFLNFILKDKILKFNVLFNIGFFIYISLFFAFVNIYTFKNNLDFKIIMNLWVAGLFLFIFYKLFKGIK